jgi:hypothetical protein
MMHRYVMTRERWQQLKQGEQQVQLEQEVTDWEGEGGAVMPERSFDPEAVIAKALANAALVDASLTYAEKCIERATTEMDKLEITQKIELIPLKPEHGLYIKTGSNTIWMILFENHNSDYLSKQNKKPWWKFWRTFEDRKVTP